MSKDSQRVEKWKDLATNGLNAYIKPIVENLAENNVEHRHQDVADLPGELYIKDVKCRMCLEYDNAKQDKWSWFVRYRNVETNEVVLESGSTTWDYAVSNMMNTISHNWSDIKLLNGNKPRIITVGSLHNKNEYVLISRFYKMREYPQLKPGELGKYWGCCPYCDSENVKKEHYCSSPESWAQLAGREGDRYECQDCGYRWDDCYRMS